MTLSSCCGFCHPGTENGSYSLVLVGETTEGDRTGRDRRDRMRGAASRQNIKGNLELDFIVMSVFGDRAAEDPNF